MSRWRVWMPLLLFAGFVALAAVMLAKPKNDVVESRLVGSELPYFALRPAVQDRPGLASADFRGGEPKLLNIFASWCLPCAAEAEQLRKLEERGVTIHGIAIRDRPEDVAAFLRRYGNPYSAIGADDLSAVQIELGSSGVPETFVIDGEGRIAYQHVGDIRAEHIPILMRELAEAES